MTGNLLLTLKVKPSFEGELSIRLVEEHDLDGHATYSVVCQKTPPFNAKEFGPLLHFLAGVSGRIVDDNLGEITKSISWRREVAPAEAREILDILQHQVAPIVPESNFGLDGTTYELLIERGSSKAQFTWWYEPPLVWKALGEVSKKLLSTVDATSTIESLQTNNRKQLIRQLREEFDELATLRTKETEELIRTHNRRCHEVARSLRATGLTCPNCRLHSMDIRFIDKSPDGLSYFICSACGRSFRPEDLQPV
jgi:hypothetical protein